MRTLVLLLLATAFALPAPAEEACKVDFYGDFRARLESDQDSRRADGSLREDRTRARIRLRFGADVSVSDRVSLGFRARSGATASQQSPHFTVVDFDDNPKGDADFNLDKWFVRARSSDGRRSGWVGRNAFPFWKQNELFWDDDVTLIGAAGSTRHGKLTVNAGYFALPVGMRDVSGNLGAAQLVYSGGAGITMALGYFDVDANPSDPDAATLLAGDGVRDYGIAVGGVQLKRGKIAAGLDLMHNTDADDEQDGQVVSLRYGGTKSKGDWLVGWWYANIERLAVVGSYAQDDWVRWGNATQTRSSDLEGHELRFAYALSGRSNLVARAYFVESISTAEDGTRFRVDYNHKLK